MVGSPEIYGHKQREAEQSVNFVTCHDGFTLNDLVSYNQKRNEANGEGNRDGANDNRSWNCGAEGPTIDPAVEKLRNRQVKNFLTITLMSLGTPMILMGDEVRHTQQGNNNAYCHDSEISWFDWSLVAKHGDVRRFVSLLCERRVLRSTKHERQRVSLIDMLRDAKMAWHGVKLNRPDWGDGSNSMALAAELRDEGICFHFIFNAFWEPLDFELPELPAVNSWRRWIDTSLDSPDDIVTWGKAPSIAGSTYRVADRSVVMLYASSKG
jgi:glycogen operon protein